MVYIYIYIRAGSASESARAREWGVPPEAGATVAAQGRRATLMILSP